MECVCEQVMCVWACVCVRCSAHTALLQAGAPGFLKSREGPWEELQGGFPGGPLHPSAPHTLTPHAFVLIQRAALKCRQQEKSDVAVDT